MECSCFVSQKADKRTVALKVARIDFDATVAELRRTFEEIMERIEGGVRLILMVE